MKHRGPAVLSALGLIVLVLVASPGAVDPGVTFIGIGLVPGNALDKSGLDGQQICQFGVTPATASIRRRSAGLDRRWPTRVSTTCFSPFPIAARSTAAPTCRIAIACTTCISRSTRAPRNINLPNIRTTLLDTVFLKGHGNQDLVGSSSDFDARFDPEGAAVSGRGSFFISDEYGPAILEFNRQGHLLRRIAVPAKFLIANPSGDVIPTATSLELYPSLNTSGRQANRGMEGLAISPDGRYLFGLMQNALIQDNGLNAASAARPCRPEHALAESRSPDRRDRRNMSTSSMRSIRAGASTTSSRSTITSSSSSSATTVRCVPTPPNTAQTPNVKRIYKIDITGATDVSCGSRCRLRGAALGGVLGHHAGD